MVGCILNLWASVYSDHSSSPALNGSRHLEFLVNKDLLHPISTPELEQLYAHRASRALNDTPIDTPPGEMADEVEQSEDRLLLEMSDAKKLATLLNAPELALEAERAILQVGEQLRAQQEKAKQASSNDQKKNL